MTAIDETQDRYNPQVRAELLATSPAMRPGQRPQATGVARRMTALARSYVSASFATK